MGAAVVGAAVMVAGAAVTDLEGEVEDTLLSVVVVTDSVVVTHLADSPAVLGFSGTRGFSTGGFSGRGDHRRFGDRGFRGRDRDFREPSLSRF